MKHDMLASRSPSRTPKSRLMVCTAIKTINLLTYLVVVGKLFLHVNSLKMAVPPFHQALIFRLTMVLLVWDFYYDFLLTLLT